MNEDIPIEVLPYKPEKKWFQSFGWKILTFIFLMPLWVVIIWTDPAEKRPMKIFSVVMLIIAILAGIMNDRWDAEESRAAHQGASSVILRPLE